MHLRVIFLIIFSLIEISQLACAQQYPNKETKERIAVLKISLARHSSGISAGNDKDQRQYSALFNETYQLMRSNYAVDSAAALFDQAYLVSRKFSKLPETSIATAGKDIGMFYATFGSFQLAELYLQRAATLYRQSPRSSSLLFEKHLIELAKVNMQLAHYYNANTNLIEASDPIFQNGTPEDKVDLLTEIQNLQIDYDLVKSKRTGILEEIIALEKEIAAQGRSVGPERLCAVGIAAYRLGNYELAEEHLLLARDLFFIKQTFNDKSASTLLYIALMDWEKGRVNTRTIRFFIDSYTIIQDYYSRAAQAVSPGLALKFKVQLNNYRDILLSFLMEYPNEQLMTAILQSELNFKSFIQRQPAENAIRLKSKSTMLSQFAQRLRPDECAVDFIRFRKWNKYEIGETYYGAFVFKPGKERSQFTVLCKRELLDTILFDQSSKMALRKPSELYYTLSTLNKHFPRKLQLKSLIWSKLLPLVKGAKTIYYSPDASINYVSMAALPARGMFLGDSLNLVPMNDLTSIVFGNTAGAPEIKSFNLIGALDYKQLSPSQPKSKIFNSDLMRETFYRVNESLFGDGQLYKEKYNGLDSLGIEINSLKKNILSWGGRVNIVLKDTAFSKHSLKGLQLYQADVLHISTHGYFFPQLSPDDIPDFDYTPYSIYSLSDNPLVRTGLAMSNANERLFEPKAKVMLNAEEISHMDLSETKIVVLSACETAKGQVAAGEGILGLPSAFKLAGAQFVLACLNRVTEEYADYFLKSFYRFIMVEKSPLKTAFLQAQKAFRKKYPDRTEWACWILIG